MKYYNNNVQWCFSTTFYDFAILCWCQRKIRNWNTKSTVTWYNVLDWLNAKKVTKHVQWGLYNALASSNIAGWQWKCVYVIICQCFTPPQSYIKFDVCVCHGILSFLWGWEWFIKIWNILVLIFPFVNYSTL